jgi:RNA polymerase sigma-70 factor, ECF subfamily
MSLTQGDVLGAARGGDRAAFDALVAPFRRELKAHCYRMSGSVHDAEDLLQDTLLRAWRALGQFEGRSSVRTWLYRVATSACLDAADKHKARTLPMALGPAAKTHEGMQPDPEVSWLEPLPAGLVPELPVSPEARFSARESVSLAFLSALQRLPPKQRAVLLLRDVLGWPASECAELLETSVPSVNSALQRARDTMASAPARPPPAPAESDTATRWLLARYLRAWEEADVTGLVALLHEDAVLSMPPYSGWFQGASAIGAAIGAMVLPPEARGVFRLVPLEANGESGFAMYARDPGGVFRAQAIHVVRVTGAKVAEVTAFLDPRLFAAFGLGDTLA